MLMAMCPLLGADCACVEAGETDLLIFHTEMGDIPIPFVRPALGKECDIGTDADGAVVCRLSKTIDERLSN